MPPVLSSENTLTLTSVARLDRLVDRQREWHQGRHSRPAIPPSAARQGTRRETLPFPTTRSSRPGAQLGGRVGLGGVDGASTPGRTGKRGAAPVEMSTPSWCARPQA